MYYILQYNINLIKYWFVKNEDFYDGTSIQPLLQM